MNFRCRLLSYILFVTGIVLLTGTVVYYLYTRQLASENLAENIPEIVADSCTAKIFHWMTVQWQSTVIKTKSCEFLVQGAIRLLQI